MDSPLCAAPRRLSRHRRPQQIPMEDHIRTHSNQTVVAWLNRLFDRGLWRSSERRVTHSAGPALHRLARLFDACRYGGEQTPGKTIPQKA